MFTKKPEAGDSVTKMGERQGGESASKMIPSIIGEGLTITGNVASKGEIQVDGEIQGDIHCGSLLLGDTAQVVGDVIAEDIVVRGRVVGSIRGVRVTLQALSHIEGDIIHQSLAIEQAAYSKESRAAQTIRWRRSRLLLLVALVPFTSRRTSI